MKKIWAIIMAAMMLAGTTVNAAWEFDEKVITDKKSLDTIEVYENAFSAFDFSFSIPDAYYYDLTYFDLKGNQINGEEYYKIRGNMKFTKDYFSENRETFIQRSYNYSKYKEEDVLMDMEGNVLAKDFLKEYSPKKTDVACVVSKGEGTMKNGIMAYDGRMIVPMEYKHINIHSNNIFSARNDGKEIFYDFNGDILFESTNIGLKIIDAGKELIAIKNPANASYALMDNKGNYLTDFIYSEISIYENPEEWQNGDYAKVIEVDTGEEKYIDKHLREIKVDFYNEKSIQCEKYTLLDDTAILKSNDKYALFDINNKEFIIPYSSDKLEKYGDYILYKTDNNSYLLDSKGNILFQFENNVNEFYGYEDGIAMVRTGYNIDWACDKEGNNIFSKIYTQIYKIDNNEFITWELGKEIKHLTAKGIIGEALYTDVKIDINGVQIPCRSVYGYAGVIAEDLRNFGFDVIWDEEKRLLSITRNLDYYNITPMEYEADGTSGTHYADIYGSDINVEYNGKRISSYCIDGRTIIKPEDLAAEGITFNYDDSVRTLFMSVEGLERK